MLQSIIEISDRRLSLCKKAPKCIKCGSEQVQLTSYINCKATWKCRLCKHKFEYEPEN